MIGYVEPVYHPAPFDTRVIAGAPPQYEKVVYQVNERNVKNTFKKLRRSYEIENLAATSTEPTISSKSSRRRRWNQDPHENVNSVVFESSLMFPPIMMKSTNDIQCTGPNPNQEFLEGIIAPPIIPVTRRRSSCEINTIFNMNDNDCQEMTQMRTSQLGRSASTVSSIIGAAPTVSPPSNNERANPKDDARESQANLNRIRAFIEVN